MFRKLDTSTYLVKLYSKAVWQGHTAWMRLFGKSEVYKVSQSGLFMGRLVLLWSWQFFSE